MCSNPALDGHQKPNTVFGCAEFGSELNCTFSFQIKVGKEMDCNSISVVWMHMEFTPGILNSKCCLDVESMELKAMFSFGNMNTCIQQ